LHYCGLNISLISPNNSMSLDSARFAFCFA